MPNAVHSLAKGQEIIARFPVRPERLAEMEERLYELTKAVVIVRGTVRDPATGRCNYVEVPDNGLRLAAACKYIEFASGKARQQIEVQTGPGTGGSAPGMQDLGKLLAKNPELVRKLVGVLTDGVKVSQAIDVTPTSETPAQSPVESQSVGSPSNGR